MSRRPASESSSHGIPEATVARLPVYLRTLYALADRGIATVSSEELAAAAGVNSAKLRKDLSHLGSYGTRGVGYDVEYLVYQVSRELGLTQDWPVLIVGAGNLGRALANYGGFASRGFRVAAMLDSDPAVVGSAIAGHVVSDADGIAPVVLNVPSGIDVRKVDLSIELQILAFHAQRRAVLRVTADAERGWGAHQARRRGGLGSVRTAGRAAAMDDGTEPEAQAIAT